jgi:hypothetical protein
VRDGSSTCLSASSCRASAEQRRGVAGSPGPAIPCSTPPVRRALRARRCCALQGAADAARPRVAGAAEPPVLLGATPRQDVPPPEVGRPPARVGIGVPGNADTFRPVAGRSCPFPVHTGRLGGLPAGPRWLFEHPASPTLRLLDGDVKSFSRNPEVVRSISPLVPNGARFLPRRGTAGPQESFGSPQEGRPHAAPLWGAQPICGRLSAAMAHAGTRRR